MQNQRPFLSSAELATLERRRGLGERVEGGISPRSPFLLDLDAAPLAILAESAAVGSGVYEFMSIRRPGDILRYLWVHLIDIPDKARRHLVAALKEDRGPFIKVEDTLTDLSFVEFDCAFWRQENDWIDDEAEDYVHSWIHHRESSYWIDLCAELFVLAERLQARLRDQEDELLLHELALIDSKHHRRDSWPRVEKVGGLAAPPSLDLSIPVELFETLRIMVRRPDVRSVSCCWTDFALWRMLVLEQVRRAKTEGIKPSEALFLSGPDSGLPKVSAADWGGHIHIPYEGCCGGDVFVVPHWLGFDREGAKAQQSVRGGLFGKATKYVITERPFGTFAKEACQQFGNWTVYTPSESS